MDDQSSLSREGWGAVRSSYTRNGPRLWVKMDHLAREALARAVAKWPRKPDIPRDKLDYLERRGADAARLMLTDMVARDSDQVAVHFAQDEVQAWLVWKAKANAFWTRTGAIAAVIAAIMAGLSWVMPLNTTGPSKPAQPEPTLIERQNAMLDTLGGLAADVRELKAQVTGAKERTAVNPRVEMHLERRPPAKR
jgi:hypothetical protein